MPQLSVCFARVFKMWFSRTPLQMACPLQDCVAPGRTAGFPTAPEPFSKGEEILPDRLQEWGCCDSRRPCWEAGMSISSDWQGGIKLLNGPSVFCLGLVAIIPTVPVTSTACGVNARLIMDGRICMLHPVIKPCGLQRYFIINPSSFQQRYFQQC